MKGCRWVESSGDISETQSIVERLGFEVPRFFWITSVAAGQSRGRHAHRESILATFVIAGGCRMTLDDGRHKQVVELKENGPGLIIQPWIWHELSNFSPDAVVLVAASTHYNEAEYIRDYDTFLREVVHR